MTGLLVPYAGTFANVGGRVLVAWNGSAQAARAVNDALPFLQSAERVVVVMVNPARGDRTEGTDIARHLARHGIAAGNQPRHRSRRRCRRRPAVACER
jgi:hypothetical protein